MATDRDIKAVMGEKDYINPPPSFDWNTEKGRAAKSLVHIQISYSSSRESHFKFCQISTMTQICTMSCHPQHPCVWTQPWSWKNDQSKGSILKQLRRDAERHFEKCPDAIREHGFNEWLTSCGRKPSVTHSLQTNKRRKQALTHVSILGKK